MWQVNPWRSLSSPILGFGLGSLGFTPIYDGLKMSCITSIHDENVNTSREVICDTQCMTKWNFVIDVILWLKLDDPRRKSTVIDHKVFCSVSYKIFNGELYVYIFMKIFFNTSLVMWFHISKLNKLKVIPDLYSKCLTQILSNTISFTKPDGVCVTELCIASSSIPWWKCFEPYSCCLFVC
jgi:hypothetical protein